MLKGLSKMAVYVDNMRSVVINPRWPYPEACHLFGNNRHELHDLAFKLGLQPRWFQNKTHFPHYDLTKGKRNQALMNGAQPVSDKQFLNFHRYGVIDEDL